VNGTSFGCAREIRISKRAILGRSSVMDTDFHSVQADRHDPTTPVCPCFAVILEDNVWVAAQAGILPGTRIRANSVVGFGAVCADVFPHNLVLVKNPAKVRQEIDGVSVMSQGVLSRSSKPDAGVT